MSRHLVRAALALSCASSATAAAAAAAAKAAARGACAASARDASQCSPSAAPAKENLLLQVKTAASAVGRMTKQRGKTGSPCPLFDVDLKGADLPDGQVAGDSIVDCWVHCRGRPECEEFTFYEKVCYLKSTGTASQPLPGAVSGSRSCGLGFESSDRPDLAAIFVAEDGGYQGADSGASVRLSDKTYLWLWGDTIVGRTVAGGERRSLDRMPRQSLAKLDMVESEPGKPNISALMPRYFQPTETEQYFPPEWYPIYWLIEGLVGEQTGALFIQVWNLWGGLEGHARTLLVVDNPTAHPDTWSIREGLIPANSSCNYAHGMYQTADWVYILGECNFYAVVARAKESDLSGLNLDAIQYWNGQDWTEDSDSQAPLFHFHWSSEASLKWHPVHQIWYVPLLQCIDPTIRLATASELTGPWTIQEVYTIPDVWGPSQNRSAYAAKSHPELASDPGSMIISYNTNSVADASGGWQMFNSENHGMANASVYRIQFIELKPKSLGGQTVEFQADTLATGANVLASGAGAEKLVAQVEGLADFDVVSAASAAGVQGHKKFSARGSHQPQQPTRADLWRVVAKGGGAALAETSGKVSDTSSARSVQVQTK